MEDRLYKAKQKAKKELESTENLVPEIRNKQAAGQPLTFVERNILNIYDRKLKKAIKRSLK